MHQARSFTTARESAGSQGSTVAIGSPSWEGAARAVARIRAMRALTARRVGRQDRPGRAAGRDRRPGGRLDLEQPGQSIRASADSPGAPPSSRRPGGGARSSGRAGPRRGRSRPRTRSPAPGAHRREECRGHREGSRRAPRGPRSGWSPRIDDGAPGIETEAAPTLEDEERDQDHAGADQQAQAQLPQTRRTVSALRTRPTGHLRPPPDPSRESAPDRPPGPIASARGRSHVGRTRKTEVKSNT